MEKMKNPDGSYNFASVIYQRAMHPGKYCKTYLCPELRKLAPKNPAFKQSRYCEQHARIAKANYEEFKKLDAEWKAKQ